MILIESLQKSKMNTLILIGVIFGVLTFVMIIFNLVLIKKIYDRECKEVNGFIICSFSILNFFIMAYSSFFNQIPLICFSVVCFFILLFLLMTIMEVECKVYFCGNQNLNEDTTTVV